MEPAKTVIEICGGYAEVARITGRSEVRVRRWEYPKERGGTDGNIPAECQQLLMADARRTKKPLRPEHFFPDSFDTTIAASVSEKRAEGPDVTSQKGAA